MQNNALPPLSPQPKGQAVHVPAFNRAQKIDRWLGAIFLFTVFFLVINSGGTNLGAQSLAAVVLSVLMLVSFFKRFHNKAIARIFLMSILCLAIFLSYGLIQSIRLENHPFEPAIWGLARQELGQFAGAISVAPENTRASLIGFAPFLVFPLALLLFRREDEALLLLQRLTYFSGALALFGLVQHLLFPNQLGFYEKIHYLQSLTATFVNRNSAGTFFGVGLCLSLGFAFFHLRQIDPHKFVIKLSNQSILKQSQERSFVIFSLLSLVQLLALMLTQSRGAVISSFVAVFVMFIIMARGKMSRGQALFLNTNWLPRVKIFALSGIVVGIFWFLAGQAAYRMEAHGVDIGRLCAYTSTLQAIWDYWPFGAGFGTFQDVFPAYRNSECAGIVGTWDIAHNTYLEGLLDMGLVFPLVFSVGYFSLVRALIIGYHSRKRYRFVPVTGISILILVSLHALVDFSMQIPGVSAFVAAAWGGCITICLGRARNEEQ